MAAEAQTEEEPSIEEILDSIRQIISDEDEAEETAPAADVDLSVTEEATPEASVDLSVTEEAAPEASVDLSVTEEATPESDLDLSAADDAPVDDFDAMVADAAAAQEDAAPEPDASTEEPAAEAEAAPQEPAADEEEIIELTQKIEEETHEPTVDLTPIEESDPTPEENAAEPAEDDAMTDDPVDDIDALLSENPDDAGMQVDMEEGDGAPEPTVSAAPAAESVTEEEIAAVVASGESDIMTEGAAGAALGAISALAQKAAVERAGNVTIEDIVREEMRPILRVWLDKNLPDIIERLMKTELERIAKDVQD